VWLVAALLIDIIQLVFLIRQALQSNKMAICLVVSMLFLVGRGVVMVLEWSIC
jgi:hypothetical protein